MDSNELKNFNESIKIIYNGKCSSLTGKSKLTYEVCEFGPKKTFHLRITDNTGNGSFSKEWVSDENLKSGFNKEDLVTGTKLNAYFGFEDNNTGGFILAALKDLGSVHKEGLEYSFKTNLESAFAERLKERENE